MSFYRRRILLLLLAALVVSSAACNADPDESSRSFEQPVGSGFSAENDGGAGQKKADKKSDREPHKKENSGHSPSKDEGEDRVRKKEDGRSGSVTVSRVVDGDTIEVLRNAAVLDIRLIGIDTPETVHPSEPVECFGPEASSFTSRSLEGELVLLEFDVERKDQYGRTLAYIWIGGKLFNKTLVRRGFATVSTYPPNTAHLSAFETAEDSARSHDRGVWGACGSGDQQGGGGGASAAGPTEGAGKGCDSNYKGACIPVYPPDLDCDDVPSGFQSIGTDPHGFDGDSDGIACE